MKDQNFTIDLKIDFHYQFATVLSMHKWSSHESLDNQQNSRMVPPAIDIPISISSNGMLNWHGTYGNSEHFTHMWKKPVFYLRYATELNNGDLVNCTQYQTKELNPKQLLWTDQNPIFYSARAHLFLCCHRI